MKILIDIAHPAHIHYFRNFSKILETKGHKCLFSIRNKGIILDLAKHYGLDYRIRSIENKSKVKYMLNSIKNVYYISKEFKPDIFLDMGTVASAPVAAINRKPYIAFDDTEVAVKSRLLHMPFTNTIITPDTFYKNLGRKQIRITSLMEMLYLHEKYFIKNPDLLKPYFYDISNFVLIRFVSWDAHHDVGKKGISLKKKMELVSHLAKNHELVISSEGSLPTELLQFNCKAPPYLMHQIIASAKFIITEGATMASESVLLATPSIYINPIQNGYSIEQTKAGLLFSLTEDKKLLEETYRLEKLTENPEMLEKFKHNCKEYIKGKIDFTSFLVWYVENYPESNNQMALNPNFQNNFK